MRVSTFEILKKSERKSVPTNPKKRKIIELPDRYQPLKKDSVQISFETLMVKQMKKNLGKSVTQFIEDIQLQLQSYSPQKAKKMVCDIQRNLKNFTRNRSKKNNHLQFRYSTQCQKYDEDEEQFCMGYPQQQIFNKKMLGREMERLQSSRGQRRSEGPLARRLMRNIPMTPRPGTNKIKRPHYDKENGVLQEIRHSQYKGKMKLKKRTMF